MSTTNVQIRQRIVKYQQVILKTSDKLSNVDNCISIGFAPVRAQLTNQHDACSLSAATAMFVCRVPTLSANAAELSDVDPPRPWKERRLANGRGEGILLTLL